MYESPKTVRPDLIGKTIVVITDPRSHGDGRIPPMICFGKIIAAEDGYARMRSIAVVGGKPKPGVLDLVRSIEPCYDEYEPGEKLDEYVPGYSAIVGKPDFVLNSYERDRAVKRA